MKTELGCVAYRCDLTLDGCAKKYTIARGHCLGCPTGKELSGIDNQGHDGYRMLWESSTKVVMRCGCGTRKSFVKKNYPRGFPKRCKTCAVRLGTPRLFAETGDRA